MDRVRFSHKEHNRQIDHMSQTVQALKVEIARLTEYSQQLSEENVELLKRITFFEEENKQVLSMNKRIESFKEDAQLKIDLLQVKFVAKSKECEQLVKDRADLVAKIKALTNEKKPEVEMVSKEIVQEAYENLDLANAKVFEFHSAYLLEKKEVEKLTEKVNSLEADLKTTKIDLESEKDSHESLKNEVKIMKEKLSHLQEQKDKYINNLGFSKLNLSSLNFSKFFQQEPAPAFGSGAGNLDEDNPYADEPAEPVKKVSPDPSPTSLKKPEVSGPFNFSLKDIKEEKTVDKAAASPKNHTFAGPFNLTPNEVKQSKQEASNGPFNLTMKDVKAAKEETTKGSPPKKAATPPLNQVNIHESFGIQPFPATTLGGSKQENQIGSSKSGDKPKEDDFLGRHETPKFSFDENPYLEDPDPVSNPYMSAMSTFKPITRETTNAPVHLGSVVRVRDSRVSHMIGAFGGASANRPEFNNMQDYLGMSQVDFVVQELQRLGDTTLEPNKCYSDSVFLFNKAFKKARFIILITPHSISFFNTKKNKLGRLCLLKNLKGITISSENFTLFVLQFDKQADILVESYRRLELISYINNMFHESKLPKFDLVVRKKFIIKSEANQQVPDKVEISDPKLKLSMPYLQDTIRNSRKSGYLNKLKKNWLGGYSASEHFCILCNVGIIYFKKYGVSLM